MSNFIKFIILSGGGWIIDLSILLFLTTTIHFNPFISNFISSIVSATIVFCISRKHIFRGDNKKIYLKVFLYLIYTFFLIVVSSMLLIKIVHFIDIIFYGLISKSFEVFFAKIFITLPQLICNYIVSRYISIYNIPNMGKQNES